MASRPSFGPLARIIAGMTILAGLALACGPAATPTVIPDGPGSPAPSPSASAAIGPSPSVAGRDAPPDAVLSVEGGDPVTGQLGTFIWLETGSDAPWLPGAPIAVGAGEPLTLRLVPDADISTWSARYVPADATGPEGAKALGEGADDPAFAAPEAGTWTLVVRLIFADGAGDASYFWHLTVE